MLPRVLIACAALCAAVIVDSRFRITVNKYESVRGRLPESFDGFKILHVSDLHETEFGRGNSRLLSAVRAREPDLIVLTGDFIEGDGFLGEMEQLVRGLSAMAPVYFVSGNHDWSSGEIESLARVLEEAGAVYLRNEYVEITRGDGQIIVAGVEDPNSWSDMMRPPELVEKIRAEYPDSYILLLGHRNYWLERYPDLDVDLILCGHGHGGQIRLPFIGGLIGTNARLFPKYTSGLYSQGRYDMVVSRGLGSYLPVPRFLNNPHLPLVILRNQVD